MTDKPLAIECHGKEDFSYKTFKCLNYGLMHYRSIIRAEPRNTSRKDNLNNEEVKDEEKEDLNSEDSISSSNNSEDEHVKIINKIINLHLKWF